MPDLLDRNRQPGGRLRQLPGLWPGLRPGLRPEPSGPQDILGLVESRVKSRQKIFPRQPAVGNFSTSQPSLWGQGPRKGWPRAPETMAKDKLTRGQDVPIHTSDSRFCARLTKALRLQLFSTEMLVRKLSFLVIFYLCNYLCVQKIRQTA